MAAPSILAPHARAQPLTRCSQPTHPREGLRWQSASAGVGPGRRSCRLPRRPGWPGQLASGCCTGPGSALALGLSLRRREGQDSEKNGGETGGGGGLSEGPKSPARAFVQHSSALPGALAKRRPSLPQGPGRSAPSVMPSASPSLSSTALTSPLRCCCRKRSSLRGRQRAASSPPDTDHPEEEPFCSRGRASSADTGASGRTCIRSSWGRSRRNTCRGDVLGGWPRPSRRRRPAGRAHVARGLKAAQWGRALGPVQPGCSMPGTGAGVRSSVHIGSTRFQTQVPGPHPTVLAQDMVGSWESAFATRASAEGCRRVAGYAGSGTRLPPLFSTCVTLGTYLTPLSFIWSSKKWK